MNTEYDVRTIIEQPHPKHQFKKIDNDHYLLEKPYGQAQINFYDIGEGQGQVVEFKIITDNEYQPKFFLHFQQNSQEHSEELFSEFLQALDDLDNNQVKEILLCCTSAFTTSFFAEKLNEEASLVGLPYHFSAVSFDQIYEAGDGKFAILLAPQIAYKQKEVAQVMKDVHVLTIPGKLFGAFDAHSYVIEMDAELKKITSKPEEDKNLEIKDLKNEERILVISVVATARQAKIYYRIHDHLKIVTKNCIRKRKLTLRDIEDIINTQAFGCDGKINVNKIGIAIPGIIHKGRINMPRDPYVDFQNGQENHFEIKKWFEEKYNVPVYILNNTNAAAVGWYALHYKEYKNIIFYSQPKGWVVGGQGIIIDGKLVHGNHGLAGENRIIVQHFNYQNPLSMPNMYDIKNIAQMISKIILMDIATLDPEVICLRSELITDPQIVIDKLSETIEPEYIPKIVLIKDYNEHIMAGALIHCLFPK